jgi:hypothetical protein
LRCVFWIWAERSISMRSPVAIGAEPSKKWTATAAAEPLGPLLPAHFLTHLFEQGDDRSLALYRGAGS